MRDRIAIALSAVVIAAVPVATIGNALCLLLGPWLVDAAYALPGFPDDPGGLTENERKDLARTGLDSIRPFGGGEAVLREARLPDGEEAFVDREVSHMEDVRALVSAVLIGWALALAAAIAAGVALRRRAGAAKVATALVAGAKLTLAAMALIGVVMLIDFEFFFDGFHAVFFEGDTWRFNETYTLRRIYPDFFWGVAGGAMAALVAAQAGGVILGFRNRR